MMKRVIGMMLFFFIMTSFVACDTGAVSETTAQKGKTIKFACLGLNKTDEGVLKIAAERFQKDNPGVDIRIVDYSKEGYDTDRYIKTLNTELMAGNGPDIMPITYLPVPKYISKRIFLNLTEVIEKDSSFDQSIYFKNILDACKYKGSMYAFPVYFGMRAAVASKDTLDKEGIQIDDRSWTLNDFLEIAGQVTKDLDGDGIIDRYALPRIPMQGVTELFISTEKYIDYEKSEASFGSSEFTELLNLLKMLEENKYTNKELSIEKSIKYKDSQAAVFSGGEIQGYRGLLSMLYRQGGGDRTFLRLPSATKSGGVTFSSNFMLAVNNKSKFKEYDWKFIKLLASEDMQELYAGSDSYSGFPICKTSFEKQLKNVLGLDWRVSDENNWVPVRIMEEHIKFVKDYVNSINTFTYSDSRINNIVVSEIGALFKSLLYLIPKIPKKSPIPYRIKYGYTWRNSI